MDANVARANVAEMMMSADQAPARESVWRREWRLISIAESLSGAWGCVRSPMAARIPRMCRSALDDLSGTFDSCPIGVSADLCSAGAPCLRK